MEEPTAIRQEPGFVYLMFDPTRNRIKIGYSKNPESRLKTLRTPIPELRLLKWIPGSKKDEASLHRKFKHLREPGEWFTGDPSLIAFIESLPAEMPLSASAPPARRSVAPVQDAPISVGAVLRIIVWSITALAAAFLVYAVVAGRAAMKEKVRSEAATSPIGESVYYLDDCSLRVQPSTRARKIGSVEAGQVYSVIKRKGKWRKIEVTGRIGWVGCKPRN